MSNLFTPGKIWYNPQQLILYLTPQQRHVVCIDPPPASEHPGQRRTNGGPQTTGQMLKVTDRTNQLFSKTGWSFCLNWQMHLDNFLEKTKFNSQTFDLLRIQPRKWGNTVPDLANDLPSSFHWLLHPAPRETLWHVNSPVLTFTPSTSHIYTAVPLPLLRPTQTSGYKGPQEDGPKIHTSCTSWSTAVRAAYSGLPGTWNWSTKGRLWGLPW